jgi:glycerol dehydrogenase
MISPSRYIQGPGVLKETGKYIAHLGSRIFVIGGEKALSIFKQIAFAGLSENSMECLLEPLVGECSQSTASDLSKKANKFGATVIIGIGGGKAIDVAKAVSYEMNSALVTIPTIASNDAPCSALSVLYKEDHQFDRFLILKKNPDVVLVDSRIIAEAPTKYFVAGMGDALSTWFEALTCSKSSAKNIPGGLATNASLNLARLCFDTLMEYGVSAKLAVDQNVVTPAVEMVIEANILLSGIGFESGGLAAAHGVHGALQMLEGAHECLHGELVAFGTIVQLVLENYKKEEIEKVIRFCIDVGLPVTLEHLGIKDKSPRNLMKAAEMACTEVSPIHNSYFEVNPELVLGAMIGANTLGEANLKALHH